MVPGARPVAAQYGDSACRNIFNIDKGHTPIASRSRQLPGLHRNRHRQQILHEAVRAQRGCFQAATVEVVIKRPVDLAQLEPVTAQCLQHRQAHHALNASRFRGAVAYHAQFRRLLDQGHHQKGRLTPSKCPIQTICRPTLNRQVAGHWVRAAHTQNPAHWCAPGLQCGYNSRANLAAGTQYGDRGHVSLFQFTQNRGYHSTPPVSA